MVMQTLVVDRDLFKDIKCLLVEKGAQHALCNMNVMHGKAGGTGEWGVQSVKLCWLLIWTTAPRNPQDWEGGQGKKEEET